MSYSIMWRIAISLGGLMAVGMGAGAAHGLSGVLSAEPLAWIHTAVMYQLIHLGCALAVETRSNRSGHYWIMGSWLFAGSLYVLALLPEGIRESLSLVIGPITPIGGIFMMVGWVMLIREKRAG